MRVVWPVLAVLLACCCTPPSRASRATASVDADAAATSIATAAAMAQPEPVVVVGGNDASTPAARPAFVPRDVGPMPRGREEDGRWSAVPTAHDGEGRSPILFKTVLHPDVAHPAAELFIVAIDASQVQLHSVAGAVDPEATVAAAKRAARPAVIPTERQEAVLAAFNGGWKSEHGHYGMKTDGVVLTLPNDASCTVIAYEDDNSIRIAPWKAVAETEPRMRFFRQTPPCLVVGGARHAGLSVELTRNWGADADGSPIIRRSAIGIDEKGAVLYVAVSNPISAPALASGMTHAGAHDIAELDVNWSYPKFLVFRPKATGDAGSVVLEAESLFPNFVFDKGEYVRKRSSKDFFYLVRR